MTVDSGPEVSGASARYQQAHIWLLGATMAALAGVIIGPTWIAEPAAAEPDLTWLALLPLFALAEVVVIHLPTLRNAHGHTLREVPAVLGLTFLAPQQYVTAYVVGAVLALVVAARMRGVKLAFNAAMFTFEAALGALAYHAILQGGDPLSPLGWLAVLVAVLITDLISAGAVTAAISLTEGAYDGEVLHEALRSGVVAAFINTCVALLVATLVLVQPSALPLLGVIVVLLVMAYRVYVSLARGHTRTQLLYRFVDRTSAVGSLAEVIDVVLIEAAGLMHAERAYLVEHLDDDGARYHAFEDGALHTGTLEEQETPPWWWSAFDAGVVHHDGSHREHGETPATHGGPTLVTTPRDGLAAPLRGADSARYVLVVCDRSFEKETFGAEDVQVFETLAAHAGVAVERARSVSDLKALAEELEVARDAALSASEAKSMFLANMSHEIRTPLTSVLATSELLGDTPLDDVQLRLLERMNRKGGQLLSLVEALLDFSRIEAGHAVLHHADFDLHALVDGIVEAHLTRATDQGVTLDSKLDPRVPRAVTGDEARVGQVLTTLVDNALKFTTDGRVHVHLGPVDGTVDVSGGGVQLTVTDTGIGIGADDQATIFESFRQVDGSATRHYEGTGLGLAIGKALTELMDGTIEVHSELGVGSTFTVRLPLASTDLTQPLTAIAPQLTA